MFARLDCAAILANEPWPVKRVGGRVPWVKGASFFQDLTFPMLTHVCSFTVYDSISITLHCLGSTQNVARQLGNSHRSLESNTGSASIEWYSQLGTNVRLQFIP